jgi:hypothetical protein
MMAHLVNRGKVQRVRMMEERGGMITLTMVVEGQKTVYEGQTLGQSKVELAKLRLLSVGDEVSFRYEMDFSNYIRDFKNHTLDEAGLDFSKLP